MKRRINNTNGTPCTQSSYRAKRMVDMCFYEEDLGENAEHNIEDDFNCPQDIFGHETALHVLSSITRTLESLENSSIDVSALRHFEDTTRADTTTTAKNDESFINNSFQESRENYQLTELPTLIQNDYFDLLNKEPEILCKDTDSESCAGSSPIMSYATHRSPVTVPESPTDTSLNNSSSTSFDKKSRKETVKYPKLSNIEKVNRNKKKYPFISTACKKESCIRKCSQLLLETERQKIWENYWNLTPDSRLKWLARNIHLTPVVQRTTGNQIKKNTTRRFFLEDKHGHSYRVCKTFLLHTLGYKNDSVITTVTKKIQTCPLDIKDNRGTNKKKSFDTRYVQEHIMSYKPCVAHYRRHNAPKVRYLNQDITLKNLYKDYTEQYPNSKCCSEVYRQTLKRMNISLHRPKSDKCFDCCQFESMQNEATESHSVLSLKILSEMCIHKEKAKQASLNYKSDAQKTELDTKVYSMDLEKSLLIPMMPEVKDCFFTSRLIVFNLTFAGLKKNDPETPAKCILWHEGTSGREAKNIIDAIYKLLLSERGVKHFIFWADNCTSQNKNWFLFTALVTIVNTLEIDTLTIKYLTKGHTHMSADGVHGNIECNIKKTKNIYDFEDFKNCVSTSRKDTTVIEVTKEDIFDWSKKKRSVKRNDENDGLKKFILKDIVEIKFVKGERTLLYKKTFEGNFIKLDFLQKKYSEHEMPQQKSSTRGVHPSKKKEVMEKLVPLMPASRRIFWHQLNANPLSVDLIDNGEIVD